MKNKNNIELSAVYILKFKGPMKVKGKRYNMQIVTIPVAILIDQINMDITDFKTSHVLRDKEE